MITQLSQTLIPLLPLPLLEFPLFSQLYYLGKNTMNIAINCINNVYIHIPAEIRSIVT